MSGVLARGMVGGGGWTGGNDGQVWQAGPNAEGSKQRGPRCRERARHFQKHGLGSTVLRGGAGAGRGGVVGFVPPLSWKEADVTLTGREAVCRVGRSAQMARVAWRWKGEARTRMDLVR